MKIFILFIITIGLSSSYNIYADECGRLKSDDSYSKLNKILDCFQKEISSLREEVSILKDTRSTKEKVKNSVKTEKYETIFEGVVAEVVRFDDESNLITIEIELRNTGLDSVNFYTNMFLSRLIDEETGKSWGDKHNGGDVRSRRKKIINPKNNHITWAKFAVGDIKPEKYSFNAEFLVRPIEGLVLR